MIRGGSSFSETFHLLTPHKLTLSLATETEKAWGRVHDAVGVKMCYSLGRKKERKKKKTKEGTNKKNQLIGERNKGKIK